MNPGPAASIVALLATIGQRSSLHFASSREATLTVSPTGVRSPTPPTARRKNITSPVCTPTPTLNSGNSAIS